MAEQDNTPWQYKPDNGGAPGPEASSPSETASPKTPPPADVTWQAPEFIEQHHGPSWYLALLVLTVVLAATVFLATRDYFAAGTIMVLGVIVWVFVGRKPSEAQYGISDTGLSVNGKIYSYSSYKSFSVFREGEFNSVNLFPLKRIAPPLSAYFVPADEEKIVTALGNYLPYEERKLDSIDRLSRRLRL